MSNNLFFEAFIYISKKKLIIYAFNLKNLEKIYENKFLIEHNIKGIDFKRLQDFLDSNILKLEKILNEFIKNIHIIIDTDDFLEVKLSIKNFNNEKILSARDLSFSLNEARYQCKKTLINQKIVHMLIDNYRIDDKDYSFLPNNLKCNNYSLDIKFICLPYNLVKELENCLEKYQISINKIVSAEYVKNYFNNVDNLFEKTKKIIEGCNPNEVVFSTKIEKNLGFFEKFFNFFR